MQQSRAGKKKKIVCSLFVSPLRLRFLLPHISSLFKDWSILSLLYILNLFLVPISSSTALGQVLSSHLDLDLASSWSCWLLSLSFSLPLHMSYTLLLQDVFPKPQLWLEKRSLQDITIAVFKHSQGCHMEEDDLLFWTEMKVKGEEGRSQRDRNDYPSELHMVHLSREDGRLPFWLTGISSISSRSKPWAFLGWQSQLHWRLHCC